MIIIPVGLGIFLMRRFHLGWRLLWIGALGFALSQVGHIPFNYAMTSLFRDGVLPTPSESQQILFNAIFLGLSAGLWEEITRYAAYRWWAKDARSWEKSLVLGAGWGGIEATLLGILVLVTYFSMIVASNLDLVSLLPAEQFETAQAQVQNYWSIPWHLSLLGSAERLFTIVFHLSASVLVLQVFIRRQIRWLWIAVFWHAWLDAVAVYSANLWGPYMAEFILAGFTLANLGIIFGFRDPVMGNGDIYSEESTALSKESVSKSEYSSTSSNSNMPDVELSQEIIENTRYD